MATTAQSVAQAATAAADSQQQQQQQQNNAIKLELDGVSSVAQPATAAVAPAQPAPATSPTGTQQMCKWSNPVCRELFQTPEDLYQHLTEQHVGRKSNNNLNLTCRWEQCNTTVIKRDHITSHLRVHVALKPHTCPKCQKSFKRPQDLKKHIKTHADDSGNGQPGGIHGGPAYSSQGGSNYYPAGMNSNSINFSFPQQSGGFHTGYPPSGGQMNHSFGANSAYWTPQASSGPQATSFSLGGLLGAQRAHAFDPHNYGSFRPQLDGYEAMQHAHYGGMPIGGGGDVAVAAPYQSPHELAQSIRTKNDLTQVHAMLKEMHQAALNHQPQHQIFPPPGSIEDYGRGSGSPPGSYRTDSVSSSYSNYNRSTTSPTPSLTPGSSVHSYQHSPAHDHVLPSTQPPVSYPSLPGATTGPVNGLGSHYDGGYRHNYRPLGKAQGQQDPKDGDADSTLDPALRGLGAAAAAADKENSDEPQRDGSATPTPESPRVIADRERETAQRQAAMLESWMEAVQKRLDVGDYEEEDDEQEDSSDHEMVDADGPIQDAPKDSTSTNPSYPDLPMPEY